MPYDHLKDFELLDNNSFSKAKPLLQTYIDSSSLGDFKLCPRRYYYSIVYGFQPASENVHLTFGIRLHEAVEKYWTLRLRQQMNHHNALVEVVKFTLEALWDKQRKRYWHSDHSAFAQKNPYTLIRTIVWYLDMYQNDPIQTLSLSGRLAVEMPFKLSSGYRSVSTGEEFTLCGRMDRLGELNNVNYIVDVKTTGRTLTKDFYTRFTPHNQFTIYTIAAKALYGVDAAGVLVDAVQVVQSFSKFDRDVVNRTDLELQQWQDDLGYHLRNLEYCAFHDDWPMNDSACDMYGGCPFRSVCSQRSENSKAFELRTQYKRRVWDPVFKQMDF